MRQGDPSSPLFFNIVGVVLSEMIKSARDKCHLVGLVPHLVPGGLTHLQYADDTVLFMTNDNANIVTIKFLLYCFEEMSGLKINYQKCEVVVIGAEDGESVRATILLNCQVGTLPTKYLGISTKGERMTITELRGVSNKLMEVGNMHGYADICHLEGELC